MIRPRARRWTAVVSLVLAASVALGACGGVVGSFVATRQAMSRAGYSDISVGVATPDDVKVTASVGQDFQAGELGVIAAIVWRDFHERFATLRITLHADDRTVRQSLSFAQIQQALGARNPDDNRTSIRSSILRLGIVVLVALAVVAVIVIVVVVALVRRRRRRASSPSSWGGPGPGGGPGGGGGPTSWGGPGPAGGPGPGGGPGSWGGPGPSGTGPDGTGPWGPPVAGSHHRSRRV